MGIWSGIKHALNSTLGTSSFKPLNTMIEEAKTSILNAIEGQRTLAASDSVLKVLYSGSSYTSSSGKSIGFFTPKKSGSVRIHAKMQTTNAESSRIFTIALRQNGSNISTTTVDMSSNSGATKNYEKSFDVPVSANVKYEVWCYTSSGSAYVTELSLCATIVDTSLIEI